MKKVILATMVTMVLSGNAMAEKNGEWEVEGSLSGSLNIVCNGSVANVQGSVNCNGNKLTINVGGESYDDTEIKEAIDKLETNKSTVITGNWGDSTDTVTNTGGGTNWKGLNDKGEYYSENYVDGELTSSFEVDLVTEKELAEAMNTIDKTDNVDVLVSGDNSYGAIIRDENGNSIEVLDRKYLDNAINENINQHEALYGNENKEGVVNTANRLDDQLNGEGGLVDQVEDINDKVDTNKLAQDKINQAQSDTNVALQGQITKAKSDILVNADNIAKNTVAISNVEKASIDRDAQLASSIKQEALIRAQEDARIQAEMEIYTTTAISKQAQYQAGVDAKQDAYMQENRNMIMQNQEDIKRLGGYMAGVGAQAAIPQSDLFVGEYALGGGLYGDTMGNEAIALQFQSHPMQDVRLNVGVNVAPENFKNTLAIQAGIVKKF